MKERLALLSNVDPYTGRYFSQAWIQRNVLRLTDDEIKLMQDEIDEEKEAGLGLPVGVGNEVAQQMMLSNVPKQPESPSDVDEDEAAEETKAAQTNESTLLKLKRIL